MPVLGDTAVVAGRSMAGLAAAAALSPHFTNVIVVDKTPTTTRTSPGPEWVRAATTTRWPKVRWGPWSASFPVR